LRNSLGIVFFWFGSLKLLPNVSAASDLVARTIAKLSFDIVGSSISVPAVGLLECLIGLGLLLAPRIGHKGLQWTIWLLLVQMVGTFTPLVLFPDETFKLIGVVPTMEGQYILKNLVLVSCAISLLSPKMRDVKVR
jgi:uncharacterized membrane protein YkgB